MHLNNGHIYPTQFMQIFSSAFCVQQLIIPERLNQISIVAHRLKGRAMIVVRAESILYLRLLLIGQRKYYKGLVYALSQSENHFLIPL